KRAPLGLARSNDNDVFAHISLTPEPLGLVKLAEAEARFFQRQLHGFWITFAIHARSLLIHVPHNTYSSRVFEEIEQERGVCRHEDLDAIPRLQEVFGERGQGC